MISPVHIIKTVVSFLLFKFEKWGTSEESLSRNGNCKPCEVIAINQVAVNLYSVLKVLVLTTTR